MTQITRHFTPETDGRQLETYNEPGDYPRLTFDPKNQRVNVDCIIDTHVETKFDAPLDQVMPTLKAIREKFEKAGRGPTVEVEGEPISGVCKVLFPELNLRGTHNR